MVETPTEEEALDAYSVIVSSVAEAVLPSVASLRIGRGGRGIGGAGTGAGITPHGSRGTSADVAASRWCASVCSRTPADEGTDDVVAGLDDELQLERGLT